MSSYVELIIVIVILGILAAYAVPKYMNIEKDARIATIKGLEGSIKTAKNLVHAAAIVKRSIDEVDIGNNQTVTINKQKYPTANSDGIVNALEMTENDFAQENLAQDESQDKGKLTTRFKDWIVNLLPWGDSDDGSDKQGIRFERSDAPEQKKCSVTYELIEGIPKITKDTTGC